MTNFSFNDVSPNCPIDVNQALQCFAEHTTYLRCQRLPIVVYVAIAGLLLLVIMDVVLLMKLRRERKLIKETGQQPQH